MVSDVEDDGRNAGTRVIQPTNDVQLEGINPLLIQNILDIIFDSLPLPCQFKYRRVCKLWNNFLVPKIIDNGKNTRLLKIRDPEGRRRNTTPPPLQEYRGLKVIDIKEILATMEAGRLEYSTCTNIYFDDSMEFNPSLFEKFLALHGKNIKVLHYDGNKISELKKVLKTCAPNLEGLSLWELSEPGQQSSGSGNGLYETNEEPKLIFPKLQNITFRSREDGNHYMRTCADLRHYSFWPTTGVCNPSENFLVDIFEASPKLHSLSCRLYGSRILEALAQTNLYSKLTSLCLKSRVSIPQLRSLISAEMQMQLKILRMEGLCVSIFEDEHEYRYEDGRRIYPNNNELMEFEPLLLEFLKRQASTLEYLKLDLFTERDDHPEIPTDVLLKHFPRMPNLITFIVGCINGSVTGFPLLSSTFAELFPKLRNLDNIHHPFYYDDYYPHSDPFIDEFKEDEDFPADYHVSPNASFSLKNIRGLKISPNLAELFPFITEFHFDGNIGTLHKIPFYLPRLKHFYLVVNTTKYEENKALRLVRILNGFMTGISHEECQRAEEEHLVRQGFEHLNQVQFARSKPSIFDLNDLESLDFKFSYTCDSHEGILSAMEVMISWGLCRMKHLKKLRFQFKQKVDRSSPIYPTDGFMPPALPDSCGTLLKAFGHRNNLETYSQDHKVRHARGAKQILVEKKWNFELNLNHYTSEWDQFKFFREDPDIWDSLSSLCDYE